MHDELTPEQETAQRINALQYGINRAENLIAELKQPKEVKKWEPPIKIEIRTIDNSPIGSAALGLNHLPDWLREPLLRQSFLIQLAHEFNEGWEPDWDNPDDEKWALHYELVDCEWNSRQLYAEKPISAVFNCVAIDRAVAMLNAGEVL